MNTAPQQQRQSCYNNYNPTISLKLKTKTRFEYLFKICVDKKNTKCVYFCDNCDNVNVVIRRKECRLLFWYAGKGWNRLKYFFETRKKVELVDVKKAMECKGNSASFEESVK